MDVNNNNYYYYNDGVVDMEDDSEQNRVAVAYAARPRSSYHNYNNGDRGEELSEFTQLVIESNDENNKKKDEKGNPFECSICLDMARDPIVTCCGHLFCWPCFSRVNNPTGIFGLQLPTNSSGRECPVCKGEVNDSAIYPIYVNNNNDNNGDSPFECGICLAMASDPIATGCGHLFCWVCFFRVELLYKNGQLLRECPVCKGEAECSSITPIYVNNDNNKQKSSKDTEQEEKWVPQRPKARRVERRAAPAQQGRYVELLDVTPIISVRTTFMVSCIIYCLLI